MRNLWEQAKETACRLWIADGNLLFEDLTEEAYTILLEVSVMDVSAINKRAHELAKVFLAWGQGVNKYSEALSITMKALYNLQGLALVQLYRMEKAVKCANEVSDCIAPEAYTATVREFYKKLKFGEPISKTESTNFVCTSVRNEKYNYVKSGIILLGILLLVSTLIHWSIK